MKNQKINYNIQEQQVMIKLVQFLYNNETINFETYKKVSEEVRKNNK